MDGQTWRIGAIASPTLAWGAQRGTQQHRCRTCNIELLTGEYSGFCCGPHGSRVASIQPLPPLPVEYSVFMNHPKISSLSRIVNLIVSFASLETTANFPSINGPPGFFAIQGRVYHRVRPDHHNSAVRWLLHDGFMQQHVPHQDHASTLPDGWINAITTALLHHNPFVRHLRALSMLDPVECPDARLELADSGSAEVAAIMCYENTSRSQVQPRTIVIS